MESTRTSLYIYVITISVVTNTSTLKRTISLYINADTSCPNIALYIPIFVGRDRQFAAPSVERNARIFHSVVVTDSYRVNRFECGLDRCRHAQCFFLAIAVEPPTFTDSYSSGDTICCCIRNEMVVGAERKILG